ncbi:hypothetical protein BR93DRAFT_922307 [Coniochaeta sp. PMI_546]|nr:hypothetical protein BR93DRAFT_922307 [Coniochaeta sp. PMI_546]
METKHAAGWYLLVGLLPAKRLVAAERRQLWLERVRYHLSRFLQGRLEMQNVKVPRKNWRETRYFVRAVVVDNGV